MKKVLQNDNFIGVALAIAAFVVYLSTLATTVQQEDCGEIATSLYTLGILHPTGYPLFTLLGWAFSHLPIGGRVIWRLNLLVAILCAVSVFFFYRTFVFLLSEKALRLFRKTSPPAKSKVDPILNPIPGRIAAAIAVLILAFSRTFWSEAVSVEVYALHLFFLSVVTLLFLRALSEMPANKSWKADRVWLGFAFALGLSFTNHMMTVLLAPAFLYLFFLTQGFGRPAWARIGRAIPPFLVGLSVYLYLPIRAAQQPLMNWGDPQTLEHFWWHVSGIQYRYKMFSSADIAVGKLWQFLSGFPAEFGYAPLLLAAVGLWALFRGNQRLLVFSLLLFLGCVFYAINYDFDDPNYYLNAYFATAIWILAGAHKLVAGAGRIRKVGLAVCVACALFPPALNYAAMDRSRDYAVEDYARNMLNSVEPGGTLLIDDDKLLLVPAMYLQLVEGVRSDVAILGLSLMMYGWHLDHLQRLHPGITEKSKAELEEYLRWNDAYEARFYGYEGVGSFDVASYQAAFKRLLESVMWGNYPARPVHVKQGIRSHADIQRIPVGLTFRLFLDSLPTPPPPKDFIIRPFVREDSTTRILRTEYARAYANQGIYRAVVVGDTLQGREFLRQALLMKPDYPPALQWVERLGAGL